MSNISQHAPGNFYFDIVRPGLIFSGITASSLTEFTLVNNGDPNVTTIVTGTGLTFDASGLTGGTVTSVEFLDTGSTIAEISGLTVDGSVLGDAIADAQGADFTAFDAILDAEAVDYSAATVSAGGVTHSATSNGDTILGSDGGDNFTGGAGDDSINPGDNSSGDFISGSAGNDTFIYSQSSPGSYQGLGYFAFGATEGIEATIDGTANTATVDKGAAGFDTIVDIASPLSPGGGFGIEGTQLGDVFNLSTQSGQFLQVAGNAGDDTFNVLTGQVRIDYAFVPGAINVDLSTGTASDDGFGDADTFTGDVWELRGSDFADIIIGSDNNESFIGREGDDFIDGGGGEDRLRFNRPGVSDVIVDLQAGTATGSWNGNVFNYTIANIERIFGGAGNDQLFGNDGTNEFNGGDGNDLINPGDNSNYDFISGSRGDDTIDYSQSTNGFQSIGYNFFGASEGVSAVIDGVGNIATIDKGSAGFDSFVDIENPLFGRGFGIEGTDFADTFEITNTEDQQLRITGTAGDDTYNINSGSVHLDFRRSQNGIDLNLADGKVYDDGFGDADTISGHIERVYGSSNDDQITGDDGSNELDGRAGNDIINPMDNTDFDFVAGSAGNDSIIYSQSTGGFQMVSYRFHDAATGLIATIDGASNTATVDKGAAGLDTITDVANPLDNGGFGIEGTALDDVFNITNLEDQWMQVEGGAGNDTINVASGLVRLDYKKAAGGVHVDLTTGTTSNDGFGDMDTFTGTIAEVVGSSFNDIIVANGGPLMIDGEDGADTVVYNGQRSDFGHDLQGDGSIVVDKAGGDSDMLIGVERIDFADGDLIYDLASPNVGLVYRIYSASFDRTPDEGGLRFWTGVVDQIQADQPELNIEVFLAEQFVGSDEFEQLYGDNPSNEEYVNTMYFNVLDRLPDQAGYDYWKNLLDQGYHREGVLVQFAQSDENRENTAPDLDDGIWVV